MVKSMFAAIAGLRTHQSKMDVIGNNIANVNTWGYKAMTTSFKDSMYTTMIQPAAATGATGATGGINASQVGYGAGVSAIRSNFTASSPSYTGNSLDLMCNGTGFFMCGPKWGTGGTDEKKQPSDVFLSRVGEFGVVNGYLVDSAGNYIYGCPTMEFDDGNPTAIDGMAQDGDSWVLDSLGVQANGLLPLKIPTAPPNADGSENTWTGYSIDKSGKITGTSSDKKNYILGYVPVINVDNPSGMLKTEGYTYKMDGEDGAAGKATALMAGGSAGELLSGYLEMANVDLAQQFADMITTQRGFQANSKIISVTDEMLQELVNMKR